MCLNSKTWKRDSHGLFDYESSDTLNVKLKTEEETIIFRKNDIISLEKTNCLCPQALAQISYQGNKYGIKSFTEPLWKVIRDIKNPQNIKGYILKQGDILKFGRINFIIRELSGILNEETRVPLEVEVDHLGSSCKICLGDQAEEGNPLVSPCKCSGTMKYIHVECLKMCVLSQMSVKASNICKSYT